MTTMSMLISRKPFIPLWLVVFALFVLSGAPITFATGVLLLIGFGVAPAIGLVLWNRPSPTVAEVLHDVAASRTK